MAPELPPRVTPWSRTSHHLATALGAFGGAAATSATPVVPARQVGGANRRILIVDDNEAIHQDFRKILAAAGGSTDDLDALTADLFGTGARQSDGQFELGSAYQGLDAVDEVRRAVHEGRPYAMAFVDVRMPPGIDGVETTSRLLEIDPHLAIVLCTAYSDYGWDEMRSRFESTDRVLILKKPFDPIEVRQIAHTMQRRWELAQQAALRMADLEQAVASRTAELRATAEDLQREMAAREERIRSIQQMLSPPADVVEYRCFELAGSCFTAESCGGDWWTYLALPDDRLLLAIGDVTGHGMPAAMVAASVRGAIQALATVDEEPTPQAILRCLHGVVTGTGGGRLLMTCFVAILDARRGQIHFANAGHPHPILVRHPEEKPTELTVLASRGTPLGSAELMFREHMQPLHPEDVLLFFSDGIPERDRPCGRVYGHRQLLRTVASFDAQTSNVRALRDGVLADVEAAAAGRPLEDDLTLVVCRLRSAR